MSKFKDMSLVEFVEDILGIKLEHNQMVALELYEDVKLQRDYTPIYVEPSSPNWIENPKPWWDNGFTCECKTDLSEATIDGKKISESIKEHFKKGNRG